MMPSSFFFTLIFSHAFILLLTLTLVRTQMVVVQPFTLTTLTLYSSSQHHSTNWSLSTSCANTTMTTLSCPYSTIFSITLSPASAANYITLSSAPLNPPFALGQSEVSLVALFNPSSLTPSTYNVSVLIYYELDSVYNTIALNVSLQVIQNVTFILPTTSLSVGQSMLASVKMYSLPASPLLLSFEVNALSGNIVGYAPNGEIFPGGGPLLAMNASSFMFNLSNWNTTQVFTIRSIDTALPYGTRWSTLNFTYSTEDVTLAPFAAIFASINITIRETNIPGLTVLPSFFTAVKNSGPYTIRFVLDCQPRGIVSLALPSNTWMYLSAASLPTFNSSNWQVPQGVSLTLLPDFSLGTETVYLPLPDLTSDDVLFDQTPVESISVFLTDADASYSDFSTNFGPPGTNLTVIWIAPLTFHRLNPSVPEATVQCVFGDSQFACANSTGFCPVIVDAVIITSTQITCTVPSCTDDPSQDMACYTPAVFHVRLNDVDTFLSANATDQYNQLCSGYTSQCLVTPSSAYSGPSVFPSRCIGVQCYGFPSHFVYIDKPVITSVNPQSIDLNDNSVISIVLTVLGVPPFSSDTAVCSFDGQPSLTASFGSQLSNSTRPASAILTCVTPVFDTLLGTTSIVIVPVEVSLTGQWNDYSSSGLQLLGTDSITIKQTQDMTIFTVCCFLALFSIAGLFFQYYCCRNCRRFNHDLAKKGKQRGEKGPQRLIDLLEPRVKYKAKLVAEEDLRKENQAKEERRRIDEAVLKLNQERKENASMLRAQNPRRSSPGEQKQNRQNKGVLAPASGGGNTIMSRVRSIFSIFKRTPQTNVMVEEPLLTQEHHERGFDGLVGAGLGEHEGGRTVASSAN